MTHSQIELIRLKSKRALVNDFGIKLEMLEAGEKTLQELKDYYSSKFIEIDDRINELESVKPAGRATHLHE